MTGSISGKVHKNSVSGVPLSGVTVAVAGKSTTTDDRGNFRLEGIRTGDQVVSFTRAGYEPFQTSARVQVGQEAVIGDRWLSEKIATGTLIGKVHKNSADGAALSGVSVSTGSKTVTTDTNGVFKLEGIGVGNASVAFSKAGYEPFEARASVVAGQTTNVGDRWLQEKVATGAVSGRVHKASSSGAVLSGVAVTAGGKTASTGADGNFKLDAIALGNTVIVLSKSGYETYQTTVSVIAGKTQDLGDKWLTEKSPSTSAALSVVPNAKTGAYRHGTFPSKPNKTHAGVDLVAPCNTSSIFPLESGTVIDSISSSTDRNFNSLGYMAIVQHAAGVFSKTYYTLYLHMAAPPNVRSGHIDKATELGKVGATGAAEGCHTHFEIRYFPGRFSAWGNIYGDGDKRNDPYFLREWENPCLKFRCP